MVPSGCEEVLFMLEMPLYRFRARFVRLTTITVAGIAC